MNCELCIEFWQVFWLTIRANVFPPCVGSDFIAGSNKWLTAAGTAQVLHLIPLHERRLQCPIVIVQ